jgi:hypothetical protein
VTLSLLFPLVLFSFFLFFTIAVVFINKIWRRVEFGTKLEGCQMVQKTSTRIYYWLELSIVLIERRARRSEFSRGKYRPKVRESLEAITVYLNFDYLPNQLPASMRSRIRNARVSNCKIALRTHRIHKRSHNRLNQSTRSDTEPQSL